MMYDTWRTRMRAEAIAVRRPALTWRHYLLVGMAVLALCSMASGAMMPGAIPGVKGLAFQHGDSYDFGDGSISRTLDGSGLTIGDPGNVSTWTHNSRWEDNWQGGGGFSNGATPGAWFVADLGSVIPAVGEMYVWNVREALDRGLRDVDVYYAISPTVAPTLDSPYDFSSGGWTSLGSFTIPQSTGADTPVDSIIDLGDVSARYVGLDINSNYGSTFRVGFAELEFTEGVQEVIPEPCTLALAGLGVAGLGGYLRRRRAA